MSAGLGHLCDDGGLGAVGDDLLDGARVFIEQLVDKLFAHTVLLDQQLREALMSFTCSDTFKNYKVYINFKPNL